MELDSFWIWKRTELMTKALKPCDFSTCLSEYYGDICSRNVWVVNESYHLKSDNARSDLKGNSGR